MALDPNVALTFQGLAGSLMGTFVSQTELHTYYAPAPANEDGEDPTQGASYSVPMLWQNWQRTRLDEELRPGDIQVKIEQAQLAVRPEVNGELEIDGQRYLVVDVQQDSAEAVWTLRGRLK